MANLYLGEGLTGNQRRWIQRDCAVDHTLALIAVLLSFSDQAMAVAHHLADFEAAERQALSEGGGVEWAENWNPSCVQQMPHVNKYIAAEHRCYSHLECARLVFEGLIQDFLRNDIKDNAHWPMSVPRQKMLLHLFLEKQQHWRSHTATLPKFTANVCKRPLPFREIDKNKHRSTDGQRCCRDAFKNRYQHKLHQVATCGADQTAPFSAQRLDLDIPYSCWKMSWKEVGQVDLHIMAHTRTCHKSKKQCPSCFQAANCFLLSSLISKSPPWWAQ